MKDILIQFILTQLNELRAKQRQFEQILKDNKISTVLDGNDIVLTKDYIKQRKKK